MASTSERVYTDHAKEYDLKNMHKLTGNSSKVVAFGVPSKTGVPVSGVKAFATSSRVSARVAA